jgi:competence protein ComEC
VYSSDCAIIRFGEETMMIDASTLNKKMQSRILTAIQSIGVTEIDTAFNSHPHDDHIDGFVPVDAHTPIRQMILTFEEDFDSHMKTVVKYCNAQEIPIFHVGDGDVIAMGPGGEVTMRVIQRNDTGKWSANDRSAMLLIQYGERTILFAGDVENRAQKSYYTTVPEGGIKADILKYPHHGQVKLDDRFLEQIDPEFVFMNGASGVMEGAKKYLNKHKIPYIIGYDGLTRMRTDGSIWVVDYVHEVETDRATKNPSYQTTTDVP